MLEGRPTLRLGAKTYPLEPGSYVVFPAGQQVGHALVNETSEPVRYLIVGERNAAEVTVHTDTGRVGVRLTGEGYCKTEVMEYWDGERGQAWAARGAHRARSTSASSCRAAASSRR